MNNIQWEEIVMFSVGLLAVILFFPLFILIIVAAGLVYAYQRWEEKRSFRKNKSNWGDGLRKSFQATMAKKYPD